MQTIRKTLGDVRLGEPRTVDGLTVFPLFGPEVEQRDYVTLEEALESKAAHVTEVSEGGSVPELRFVNDGEKPVLLVDGAALMGAKQDRVINITIVAPGKGVTVIPVSCCESGRWHRQSAAFRVSPHAMYARARASKMRQVSHDILEHKMRRSDQGAVWADIDAKMSRMAARSPSSAMLEMYEQHSRRLENYAGSFPVEEGQTGVLLGLDGKVFGLDLFDSGETLATYLPKILRSYAMDAIEAPPEERRETAPDEAARFLDEIAATPPTRHDAVGLGADLRLESASLTGGALELDGRVVHLAAFRASAPM